MARCVVELSEASASALPERPLGSIDDVVARLALWATRAPKGLARVEFDSEFARQHAVRFLRAQVDAAGLPFREIQLPVRQPADAILRFLLKELSGARGAVSIAGLDTAFADDVPLADALRLLNFNRENLARFPVCQIWWMSRSWAEALFHVAPDLNSWFMVRLQLTENVLRPETYGFAESAARPRMEQAAARQQSARLVARFKRAAETGASVEELRRLAIPAVNLLLEAGADVDARELQLLLAGHIRQALSAEGVKPDTDFLICYHGHDARWLAWVSWELKEAGYSVRPLAWDSLSADNFVWQLQDAASHCERLLPLLSPHFLASKFTDAEWATTFALGWLPNAQNLFPVRVEACEPSGGLAVASIVDLVGLGEADARAALLEALGTFEKVAAPADLAPNAVAPLRGEVKPVFPGALPRYWNVPFERNRFFAGREDVLRQLKAELRGGAVALSQAAAISGLGGIGKTQTAVEFAYRHDGDYDAVLWVGAESETTLVSGFAALASLLDLPEKDEAQQQLAVQAVQKWLSAHEKWLLILDNADDLPLARRYVPNGVRGHVLYTTRSGATGAVAKKIPLEKLSDEDGARLLLRRAGCENPEDSPEWDVAKAISVELGGLPLALEQAGAYIEDNSHSLAEYLELYKAEGVRLLKKHSQFSNQDHKSVTVTFSLAFQQVAESNPVAADLLRLCAFLAPDNIPEEIFEKGAAKLDGALGEALQAKLQRGELIGEVCRRSLLTRDAADRSLSIHRLVQAVLREEMSADEKCFWAERAVNSVNAAFPDVQFEFWQLCERLLPHTLDCLSFAARQGIETESVARLSNQAAYYLQERAQYAAAEPLYERALAIREKLLGPEHPETGALLNNLGMLYQAQRKSNTAEPLLERSLPILEKVLGPQNPNVATALNNLALLYKGQGRLSAAEPLYERSLAIREKVLGPQHPQVANSLNNLALLYQAQGNLSAAEPLHMRSLAIRETVLGPDHPDTAQSLNNVASLYQNQGKLSEAAPLLERALAILEKTLGAEHPTTAMVRENLAELRRKMGK